MGVLWVQVEEELTIAGEVWDGREDRSETQEQVGIYQAGKQRQRMSPTS